MKKKKTVAIVSMLIWLLFVGIMYYLLLPAMNLHSVGLWFFVIMVVLLPAIILAGLNYVLGSGKFSKGDSSRLVSMLILLLVTVVAIFIVMMFFGSQLFHAKKYASILETKEYTFTEDIDQSSALSKIALMDTNSAILLGNREVGSLSEVVSQYNVSDQYTQIALGGFPVKVAALDYAGIFKYFGNNKNGVPGYVSVDPVGQNADYVKLKKGMKFVPSAYFTEDLRRHIRLKYPTKIFGNMHFEVDENGQPFYIASVYQYTIGMFGGETVSGAIICNPINGACEYYDVGDIPTWVDDVFDGNLLVTQYNWYGNLNNGFFNSLFGKKGCKKCTETIARTASGDEEEDEDADYAPDYGYVAKDGDIWIYTGVTSVNDDASNIGFILVNERTGESHFYSISGADENSAMSAAEGEVQEKGYMASFPSLINVDNHPTYIMVLKDASGIVKLYAMVNVEQYNIVTTASNMDSCFQKYRSMIGTGEDVIVEDDNKKSDQENVEYKEEDKQNFKDEVTGIQYVDIEGNTYVYITGKTGEIYKQKFSDNEKLVLLKMGDVLEGTYVKDQNGICQIVQ